MLSPTVDLHAPRYSPKPRGPGFCWPPPVAPCGLGPVQEPPAPSGEWRQAGWLPAHAHIRTWAWGEHSCWEAGQGGVGAPSTPSAHPAPILQINTEHCVHFLVLVSLLPTESPGLPLCQAV